MRISLVALKRAAYLCLLCPCLIFLIGFLKWYVGVPVALLLAVAYFFAAAKKDADAPEEEPRDFVLAKKHVFLLVGVVALWCWLAGIGNLYYQSADWWARNAVFRDLITRDWPVIYPEKNAAHFCATMTITSVKSAENPDPPRLYFRHFRLYYKIQIIGMTGI